MNDVCRNSIHLRHEKRTAEIIDRSFLLLYNYRVKSIRLILFIHSHS